jgi:hypothetical protein
VSTDPTVPVLLCALGLAVGALLLTVVFLPGVARAGGSTPPPVRPVAPYQCVGYAVVGWLATATGNPWSQLPTPTSVYNAALVYDAVSIPHAWRYTRSGFRVLEHWGWVQPGSESYVRTVAQATPILQRGPVVVTFVALGLGHAIFCYGIDLASGKWQCQDSSRFLFAPRDGDEVWTARAQ